MVAAVPVVVAVYVVKAAVNIRNKMGNCESCIGNRKLSKRSYSIHEESYPSQFQLRNEIVNHSGVEVASGAGFENQRILPFDYKPPSSPQTIKPRHRR